MRQVRRSNRPGPPQNLFCGAFVHFPPAESGQKGRRGAFVPRRRVPASDFRQFICRKSMKFPGDPAKPVLRGNRNAPRNPPFALSEDGFCCTPAPRLPRGLALPLRGTKGRETGKRASSHRPLPPLCKGRWRTNVSRRGCRSGAGEGGLIP